MKTIIDLTRFFSSRFTRVKNDANKPIFFDHYLGKQFRLVSLDRTNSIAVLESEALHANK